MSSTAGKHVQWNLNGTVYHSLKRNPTTHGHVRGHPAVILRAGCGASVGNEWQKPVEGSERHAIQAWGLRACVRCFGKDYGPVYREHLGAV